MKKKELRHLLESVCDQRDAYAEDIMALSVATALQAGELAALRDLVIEVAPDDVRDIAPTALVYAEILNASRLWVEAIKTCQDQDNQNFLDGDYSFLPPTQQAVINAAKMVIAAVGKLTE